MPKEKLTNTFIKHFPKPERQVEIYDELVQGMALRVTPTGHKSFVLRYWYDASTKRYTIGPYGDWTLAEARAEARKLKKQVNEGRDPVIEKQNRQDAPPPVTFKQLAAEWLDIHLEGLRQDTRDEHDRIVHNELIPAFGSRTASELSRKEVVSFLDKKAIKKGKKVMANRIRSRLHSIYEFGVHRGIVEFNPITAIKGYPEGETKRERYYSEEEIKKLWAAFENQREPARSIMQMLLLTGQRSKETRHMRWEDIEDEIWTIPASLAKGKRTHHVPLSRMAIQVIERIRPLTSGSDWVFNSPVRENQPLNSMKRSIKNVRDESGVSDFRLHDLRRTAATHLAKLNIDRTTLGKLLNHKGLAGDGLVTAIYDRHEYLEEKRLALQRWSSHLQQILDGETKRAKIYKLR